MSRGLLLRVSVAAAVLGSSALALLATGPAADAAPRSSCVISGSVSPTVVQRGENVTVTANVQSGSGAPCRASSLEVRGGSFVLRTAEIFNGSGGCTTTFGAFDGLSAITVVLSNGQSKQIGTVTVLSPTPTQGTTSSAARRTVTVTPPASRAAASSSSAAAASRSAAARASRAATRVRTSTVTSTAFPSDTVTPSTSAATAEDSPAADTASASGFSVNVRSDPSGGSSIPFLPLLIALLVLAGFVTAAGRFIYAHIHEELEA